MEIFSILRLPAVFALMCSLSMGAMAQTPSPVGSIFNNKGELGIESVRNAALAQSTATPYYKSNGVETRYYEGYFRAASNNSKLALLSDDGTSVWIDGQQILNRAGQGQGFENFDSTFYPLSKTFMAGQIYHLKLQYTNTTHLSDADVDGISLWAYDGGGEIVSLNVSVSATETEICAGGVTDDAHQTTITAVVKDSSNAVVPSVSVVFSVENSHGEYPAALTAASASTNPQGEATTTLTSSRKIGATAKVKARVATFEAQTASVAMQDAEETWDISPKEMAADGESTATIKLTLKYKNKVVTGHQVTWRINKVTNSDGQVVYTADPQMGSAEGYGSVSPNSATTNASGDVETTYTVGTSAGTIQFAALDYTVVANSSKVRVNIVPLKMNKFYVYTYVGDNLSGESAGNTIGTRGSMRFYVTLNAIVKQSRTQGSPPVQITPPSTINFLRKRADVSDSPLVQGQLKPNPQASDPNVQTVLWEYWAYSPTEASPAPSGWDITKLRGKWTISVQFPQPRVFEQQRADFKIDKRDQIVQLARSWKGSTPSQRLSAGAASNLCGGFTAMVYEHLSLFKPNTTNIPSGTDAQNNYMPVTDGGKGSLIFFRSHTLATMQGWHAGHVAIRDGDDRINTNSNTGGPLNRDLIIFAEPLFAGINPNGSGTDYLDTQRRSSVDLDAD